MGTYGPLIRAFLCTVMGKNEKMHGKMRMLGAGLDS